MVPDGRTVSSVTETPFLLNKFSLTKNNRLNTILPSQPIPKEIIVVTKRMTLTQTKKNLSKNKNVMADFLIEYILSSNTVEQCDVVLAKKYNMMAWQFSNLRADCGIITRDYTNSKNKSANSNPLIKFLSLKKELKNLTRSQLEKKIDSVIENATNPTNPIVKPVITLMPSVNDNYETLDWQQLVQQRVLIMEEKLDQEALSLLFQKFKI
jgi:hypothetical protein